MECIEKDFSNIMSVSLYPLGSITGLPAIYGRDDIISLNLEDASQTSQTGGIISNDANPIVLVHTRNINASNARQIECEDIKINASGGINLPGYLYECTVEFSTSDISVNTINYMRMLDKPHEAVITYWNGKRMMIRTERDAYKKEDNNDGVRNITLSFSNGQGASLVI